MVAATGRGILVTRFNYNRPIHPLKTLITGMTRDGAWYVEDGKVQYPIKDLRYTQSVLEALNSVDMIGRDTELKPLFMLGAARVPAMKLSKLAMNPKYPTITDGWVLQIGGGGGLRNPRPKGRQQGLLRA